MINFLYFLEKISIQIHSYLIDLFLLDHAKIAIHFSSGNMFNLYKHFDFTHISYH